MQILQHFSSSLSRNKEQNSVIFQPDLPTCLCSYLRGFNGKWT